MQLIAATPSYLLKRYGTDVGAISFERRGTPDHIVLIGRDADTLRLAFEAACLTTSADEETILASLWEAWRFAKSR